MNFNKNNNIEYHLYIYNFSNNTNIKNKKYLRKLFKKTYYYNNN